MKYYLNNREVSESVVRSILDVHGIPMNTLVEFEVIVIDTIHSKMEVAIDPS